MLLMKAYKAKCYCFKAESVLLTANSHCNQVSVLLRDVDSTAETQSLNPIFRYDL